MNQSASITNSGNVRARSTLAYEVFVSDPIPFDEAEKAPNGDQRMYQPISSTLIFGETDADTQPHRSRVLRRNGHPVSEPSES
jgi:hypothetical protein